MDLNYKNIGKRIRKARKTLAISQEYLAELTNLSPSHVSHIENGKTKLSLPSIILIANALNTTVDSLLYDNINILLNSYDKDFKDLLSDCTNSEKMAILHIATELKNVLKKYK